MGIPDHLTCLLRNLYAGQEATVRTGHVTMEWFQTRKGVRQGCILSLCLFNLYSEYIMWNAGMDGPQLESRFQREISITSDMQMTSPLWQKERRTKEPLDESERGEWKAGIKLNIQKNEHHGIQSHHFMANRWGNCGNSERLYIWGLQNHCTWWL